MNKRLVGPALLAGFLLLAVLLHRSTAGYPAFVQGSTASYVRFLAWSLGILCVADLVFSLRRRTAGAGEDETGGRNPRRFWSLLVLLAAYSWALGIFGFFASSLVFLPLTMAAMGSRRPLPIAGTTVGILIFVYIVFVQLLEVSLPEATLF
ncbi:tripartite tricarboxylate transporter TctB family protein [Oleispirillum naphthae]|uniref:tripartite tricarboxylate transporter TctB family protein n=1 Tax=Oleispirillum naphthae TaxID=2838853 RepID=UPI0030822839